VVDLLLVVLFSAQVMLLLVIACLVADNNRIARECQRKSIEAAWCRAIVDAFVGKVEKERGK
jgi:hypothetical protein